MKKVAFIFLLFNSLNHASAQKISNVDWKISATGIEIQYDLEKCKSDDLYNISVYFESMKGEKFFPVSISGDLSGVYCGGRKTILWNNSQDKASLDGYFKAVITAQKVVRENSKSGSGVKKGFVAILGGPSTPAGDLASVDLNYAGVSFAQPGTLFELLAAWRFGKNFGIATSVIRQSYPVDVQAIEAEIVKDVPSSSYNVEIESEAWCSTGLLFGGYGSFPISRKFSFDARLMLGFLSAVSPELTEKISNPLANESFSITRESASSDFLSTIAYMAGAGIRFNASRSLLLLANLSYLVANPEFSAGFYYPNGVLAQTETFSKQFNALNAGFGIGFRF